MKQPPARPPSNPQDPDPDPDPLEDWFDQILSWLRAALWGRIPRGSHLGDDLDDHVQACATRVWESRSSFSFRGARQLKHWVRAFARRHAQHARRDGARRGRGRIELVDPERLTRVADRRSVDETPSGEVRRKEERDRLDAAMARLPPHHRLVLKLHYWQDAKGAALAEALSCCEPTARRRLAEAEVALMGLMTEGPDRDR